MCPGLDYFSLDTYRDDPAGEVGAIKALYAPLIPKVGPDRPSPCLTRRALVFSRTPWMISSSAIQRDALCRSERAHAY